MELSKSASWQIAKACDKQRPGWEGLHWVYIVCWQQRGPCKIGMAMTPHGRIGELQTGNPYRLHIWRAYGFTDRGVACEVEQLSLSRLRGMRMQGEWVRSTVNQTEDAVLSVCASKGLTPSRYDKKGARRIIKEKKAVIAKQTKKRNSRHFNAFSEYLYYQSAHK